ncbi:hypothetical protein NUW58_g4348 [Xylaria curta]|uniref:Uncharacterized protein n=2 Tax=Xylaria curta TaxID=42375 RepID=A0ACC1MZX2_9PEZI|nr:hypothetical protein NUW58_g9314 [Xylaria curta]KAJ2987718.1 hypothetical protein NUW58_g4348 [Xylaria curta]
MVGIVRSMTPEEQRWAGASTDEDGSLVNKLAWVCDKADAHVLEGLSGLREALDLLTGTPNSVAEPEPGDESSAGGASAVLCFGVIESPLAQPRAVIGGHFVSALTGVIFTRIFSIYNLSDADTDMNQPRLAWLAASLSTATAIVAMQLSKTTHPPAGATALLPILDPRINGLNWYLLPVVLLSSTLMVAVALLTNNIQRRYPIFWLSPHVIKPTNLPVSQNNAKESSESPSGEVPLQNSRD